MSLLQFSDLVIDDNMGYKEREFMDIMKVNNNEFQILKLLKIMQMKELYF
ncbi:hypothetical protein CNEO3_470025 [Clostridium neonatale]|nr:hypothetical protein CNEO3_20222 [Clostridium neonatale]CAI3607871.1 hypothetical protein CNEO4_220056 [Clostridium neonatale]CAI3612037.1 hypothetical protein CNEO3_380025 [Clostridium neonatale]CAI3647529.1 hypothetical protein CNEO3_460025 [Clostridium neonatale]CAI3658771.1 hypothetical protein CNEO3_430025 [Clostridium neonatale]